MCGERRIGGLTEDILRKEIRLNALSKFGARLLDGNRRSAPRKGFNVIVRELLDKNADPKISIESGASPLYVAAMKGQHAVCRILLGCGRADANQTPGHQKTPLLVAILNGHEEAFRFNWVCMDSP